MIDPSKPDQYVVIDHGDIHYEFVTSREEADKAAREMVEYYRENAGFDQEWPDEAAQIVICKIVAQTRFVQIESDDEDDADPCFKVEIQEASHE